MADEREEFKERLYLIFSTYPIDQTFVKIPEAQIKDMIERIDDALDYFDIYGHHPSYARRRIF